MGAKKNKNSGAFQRAGNFKDMLLQIARSFFHNLFEQVRGEVKAKVEEFIQIAKRVATVVFLVVVGVLFLFVGMANLIDSALGMKGAGFLFIGIVLTSAGFLINILNKNSK